VFIGDLTSAQLLDNEPMIEPQATKAPKSKKKELPATYEPDKRTSAWLKLKKDYVIGLGDSLDLIPIGAWHGNGRKAGWWSPILLGVWQPETSRIVAVCKCMSGSPQWPGSNICYSNYVGCRLYGRILQGKRNLYKLASGLSE
jgi:hypothetical protein